MSDGEDRLFDEEATQVDMCAGGGGVQRRPQFTVEGVNVRSVLDEKARHLLRVVDAALQATQHAFVRSPIRRTLATENCI